MRYTRSFTTRPKKGIASSIITPCGVCAAFDPRLKTPPQKIENFFALWDTGATNTVVSPNLVKKLNLQPTGKIQVRHAGGTSLANKYAINLILPNQVGFSFVPVTEGNLVDFDVLIGMDIITQGDFSITNFNGKTTFSFRIPSCEEIDFLAQPPKKPQPTIAPQKIGRNEPCHCGSGKKYKVCHGKTH